MPVRRATRFAVLIAALLALCLGIPEDRSAGADPAGPGVRLLSRRTVVEVGRPRVIAFRMAAAPASDVALPFQVADSGVLEVVRPPAVLGGESLGYLRVLGVRPGKTRLVLGAASLEIEVRARRAPEAPDKGRPVIVGPATGAAIWGTFAVGVELDPDGAPEELTYELRLSDGGKAALVRVSGPARGPTRRIFFTVDAGSLAPGPLELVAVASSAEGRELHSDPVEISVIRPRPEQLRLFEAEAPPPFKRPERYGDILPSVGVDADASAEEFIGSDQTACFPLSVPQDGLYQAMAIVRGTFGGGAWPTVALLLDNDDYPVTNGRALDDRWHRISVGVPFRLAAGEHVIAPYMPNGFAALLSSRNLEIDRIEITRLDDPADATGTPDLATAGKTMGKAMVMSRGRAAGRASPLRVAFGIPLGGLAVTGPLAIPVAIWQPDPTAARPPAVTLLVNERPVTTQWSLYPYFSMEAAWFKPGANTLRLLAARDSGETAESPVVTVHCPLGASPADAPRPNARFTAHDDAWDPEARALASADREPVEGKALAFRSNGRAVLRLPNEITGAFDVAIEALGDEYEGPPMAIVAIEAPGNLLPVGEVAVPAGWNTLPVGAIDLPPGPKSLVVTFANDAFAEAAGDRNLYLQAVTLSPRAPEGDETPPEVHIAWPPEGHETWNADALVADAFDISGIAAAEMLVDGIATGIRLEPAGKPGRLVFPVLLRGLPTGAHTLAVRATDGAGNAVDSGSVGFRILERAASHTGRYARAVHLLNRFAYGPDPQELAAVLTEGEERWLEDRLRRPFDHPAEAEAMASARTLYPANDNEYDPAVRVMHLAMTTRNPARTRLVQWVENHFSTWSRKVGMMLEWRDHVTFRRLGAAPFADLLFASASSPTMLLYLDQQYSFAHNLNENYAREIMELHTLGVHGGYTQKDVTTLARLLTGWTFSDEGDGYSGGPDTGHTFRFDPALHENGEERFLGMAFAKERPGRRWERPRLAIEQLAAHPSTARFVCRKLAEHYVALPAPDGLVDDLVRVFEETGGDLAAQLLAIARHPSFWEEGRKEKVATPFDLAVRVARAAETPLTEQALEFLARCAHQIWDRATPDGYPEEDRAYTDTNTLIQRWRYVRTNAGAIAAVVPASMRNPEEPATAPWRQTLVDLLALRLTGRLLGGESNRAALGVLEATQGTREEIVLQAAAFVAQLPETSMR